MDHRRYDDDEVRQIFRLASLDDAASDDTATNDAPGALRAAADGLSLDELQRIGEQVGLSPARVREAAARLDLVVRTAPTKRSLGMPISVTRAVDLPRTPTEREWHRLVAMFRDTFSAQGTLSQSGGLRAWSNGNLHVSIEPTANGDQLRFTSTHELVQVMNGMGLLTAAMAAIVSTAAMLGGKPQKALVALGLFGTMSLIAFVSNLIRSPRWAKVRAQQMEALAKQSVAMLSSPPDEVNASDKRLMS